MSVRGKKITFTFKLDLAVNVLIETNIKSKHTGETKCHFDWADNEAIELPLDENSLNLKLLTCRKGCH